MNASSSRLGQASQSVSFDAIKRSHALDGDVGNLDEFYRDWVDSYDADVTDQGYRAPARIVELTSETIIDRKLRPDELTVLDAGCGTGLVGIELARAGFTRIDGIDLSEPMVRKAASTGCYRALRGRVDLNRPMECLDAGAYDLLVCCGVFTLGHVAAAALTHLVDAVRAGGILVVSTRDSYLNESEFTQYLDKLIVDGELTLLHVHGNEPYIDEETATYWILRTAAGPAPRA
ncbi:class I SAM-dependent methyltransferase [Amycolatopsis sp. YIM 10]|uniref:class I SAM-dependent DNA methyltransferase n=1 Tax=Amycolatopsis sp. YIM 10 TaxID=2653857 RepID=UPI00188368AC|nr:methyltransferase domain-containing protein [Amycolatopsis sp. YIM 10]